MSKKPIERTSRGLAQVMFEELELLRAGESTPQTARAKAALANTICTISRLEMDYARFVTVQRNDTVTEGMNALPMG